MNETALAQLLPLLQQEHQLASRLYELLAQELVALEHNDAVVMQSLAQEKSKVLSAIDAQAGQRERIFPDALDTAQMTKLTANASPTLRKELLRVFSEYRIALQHCKKQNDINGRVIQINRRHLSRHLSLLRGQQPDSIIYNQKGATARVDGQISYALA